MVNNGSTDHTRTEIQKAMEITDSQEAFQNTFKLIDVKVNKGYGFGIMSGVQQASGDYIAWTHADMQTDPNDVLEALKHIKTSHEQPCILKGKRIGRPFLDNAFTFGMTVISSLALGYNVSDVNAQPKIFHRDFLEHLKEAPDDFSLDLHLLVKARIMNLPILEHHVIFSDRLHGEAKGGGSLKGKFKLIQRTWKYIFETRQKLRASS